MEILKKNGIKAVTAIDPVFLLSMQEWHKIIQVGNMENKHREYVLCYVMPGNKVVERKIFEIAHVFAKENGVAIITIGKKTYARKMGEEILVHSCGPLEFLSFLHNAKMIVTNSFHGTAFSLIFHKQFWTVIGKGVNQSKNERLLNILDIAGLSHRLVWCENIMSKQKWENSIDYSMVDKQLAKLIIEAKDFLYDATNA